jgi:hypothetical protein
MTSKPSSYGPTEAVAEAVKAAAGMYGPQQDGMTSSLLRTAWADDLAVALLTALRARGYVVTKEYQE